MQLNKQEVSSINEGAIDLKVVFTSLLARKFLIAGLTGLATVLAILYAQNLTPIYQATSSFTSPSSVSVASFNTTNLVPGTKNTIFTEFLTHLSSKELQKRAFINGGFLPTLNKDNSPIVDTDAYISNFTSSVRVQAPSMKLKKAHSVTLKDQTLGFLVELPYSVSIEGEDPENISEYLNALVALADSESVKDLIKLNELKISTRIDEMSLQLTSLLMHAKNDRLSKIMRIKEEDSLKINQINDEIERSRFAAKESRLNQIVKLKNSISLANALGVFENNFALVKDKVSNSDLNINIGVDDFLPEWYLYGEKALTKRLEILNNRKIDDPYITELITLKNQLKKIQNNNTLKILEERQDDSPFIDEINQLVIDLELLKSKSASLNSFNTMTLHQFSLPPKYPFKSNKRRIVLLAFIGSLMMSILLVLIMSAIEPDEKAPA